jgi:hypothetical protein
LTIAATDFSGDTSNGVNANDGTMVYNGNARNNGVDLGRDSNGTLIKGE